MIKKGIEAIEATTRYYSIKLQGDERIIETCTSLPEAKMKAGNIEKLFNGMVKTEIITK